ncbi:hypothetical protein BJ546DRAFT_560368 [Cryomyces antarcticus]
MTTVIVRFATLLGPATTGYWPWQSRHSRDGPLLSLQRQLVVEAMRHRTDFDAQRALRGRQYRGLNMNRVSRALRVPSSRTPLSHRHATLTFRRQR